MEIENERDDVSSVATNPKVITHRFKKGGNFRKKRDDGNVTQAFFISDRGGTLSADDMAYVSSIVMYSPDSTIDKSHLQITFTDIEGRKESIKSNNISSQKIGSGEISEKVSVSDAYVTQFIFRPNRLIKSVEIKIPKKINGEKITFPVLYFSVWGYPMPRIKEIAERFDFVRNKVSRIKDEANDAIEQRDNAQLEKNEIAEEKESLIEEKKAVENQIEDLKNESTALDSEVENLKEKKQSFERNLHDFREKHSELNNNNQKLMQSNEALNREISDKERTLRQLEADRNIISDEYHDYVEEGVRQSSLYYRLVGVSLVIVLLYSLFLIYNAIQYLSHDPKSLGDTVSLIMQRSPFVVGSLAIAGASFGFAKFVFDKLVNINQKRLDLTKLLILAKEVSFSANDDALVSDEVMYKERVRLKIEMLKAHLVKDIGEDGLKSRLDKISREVADSNQSQEKEKL